MKDAQLIITFLTGLAISLAVIMVSLNIAPSWSQYARTLEEPLLFATLLSICFTFLIKAYNFKDREFKLFNLFGMNVRVKHLNKATSVFFALVLIFPVTHPYKWIEVSHLIFTGAAIISAYLEIGFYYRSLKSYVLISLGATLFLLSYFLRLYSVGLGELFAALVIAYYTIYSIKLIRNE